MDDYGFLFDEAKAYLNNFEGQALPYEEWRKNPATMKNYINKKLAYSITLSRILGDFRDPNILDENRFYDSHRAREFVDLFNEKIKSRSMNLTSFQEMQEKYANAHTKVTIKFYMNGREYVTTGRRMDPISYFKKQFINQAYGLVLEEQSIKERIPSHKKESWFDDKKKELIKKCSFSFNNSKLEEAIDLMRNDFRTITDYSYIPSLSPQNDLIMEVKDNAL